MNKVWFGKSLSDAVDDPRVHQNLVPEMSVEVEKKKKYRLSKNIQDGLRALGHKVMVASDSDFAVVQAVYRWLTVYSLQNCLPLSKHLKRC